MDNALQKRVLVINAAPMFREFLKEKLSAENVDVEITTDGHRDAFSKIIRMLPDLIVIDIEGSFVEIIDLLKRKSENPNAKKIPVILAGPVIDRAQISSLIQFGVIKYFSKPIKFDVFFEAVGKIIRVNLSMDTTPCVLEIHHNGNIIFVEIAQGLNREKISILKYKISEMIDTYKIKDPRLIVMMSNLELSFVDGINVELLLDTVTADERILKRNVKILSLDKFMDDFIDGHLEYVGVKVIKDLTTALGSLVGTHNINDSVTDVIAESILAGDERDAANNADIRFDGSENDSITEGSVLNIAVVDDDEIIRKILSQLFTTIGATTDVYDNGTAFLQAIQTKNYDLAIVDLLMQGASGFDILNQLRTRVHPIPTIVYSQAAQREYVIQSLSLGAKGYLAKPQKPEVILQKAMEVLHGQV